MLDIVIDQNQQNHQHGSHLDAGNHPLIQTIRLVIYRLFLPSYPIGFHSVYLNKLNA